MDHDDRQSLQARIRTLYAAFNARDLDTLFASLDPDVDWENGWKGGRVHGLSALREYWTRQWGEIDPHVEPLNVTIGADGVAEVDVRQTVRDLTGRVLGQRQVRHVYRFHNGRAHRMDIIDANPRG